MRQSDDWSLTLVEDIRRALEESGLGVNELGRQTGVNQGQLSRFMRRERTLTLPAAARVCQTLGLRLVLADTAADGGKAPGRPRNAPAGPASGPANEGEARGQGQGESQKGKGKSARGRKAKGKG